MFDIILFFLFCYFAMQAILVFMKLRRDNDIREEVGELIAKAEEELKKILVVRVEKHGEMYYLFNQTNDEFICQGKDLEEVKRAYILRFPNKRALVDEGKELLFKEEVNV